MLYSGECAEGKWPDDMRLVRHSAAGLSPPSWGGGARRAAKQNPEQGFPITQEAKNESPILGGDCEIPPGGGHSLSLTFS